MKLGILGGGQLGAMLTSAALRLGVDVKVLDPTEGCPAARVGAEQLVGSFRNEDKIRELADEVDVMTYEIENVAVDVLLDLVVGAGKVVYPHPNVLKVIRDKLEQKRYFARLGVAQPRFEDDWSKIPERMKEWGCSEIVMKTRSGGYDGKGVWVFPWTSEGRHRMLGVLEASGMDKSEFYFEEKVVFSKELAILALECEGGVKLWPVVETIQKDGICVRTEWPVKLDLAVRKSAEKMAQVVVNSFGTKGVFALEMFLVGENGEKEEKEEKGWGDGGGRILLNEVSPRVHNSGHYTIEGCNYSQFEQHIRAVCGFEVFEPLVSGGGGGGGRSGIGGIVMENMLAIGRESSGYEFVRDIEERKEGIIDEGGSFHWYGKKMDLVENGDVELGAEGSSFGYKGGRKIGHMTRILDIKESRIPVVYVVMGSKSDLDVMQGAYEVLREYGVNVCVDVVSAHRSPAWMYEFGRNVESWGGRVVIAGAGGAAHLPGMLASLTRLPVIGVPVPTAHLRGEDSLLSIVEMPNGVPVATVGIGKSRNAGILALRMLGGGCVECVEDIMRKNEEKVELQRGEL